MVDTPAAGEFAPAHKTTLVESVMEQIIAMIRRGQLQAGSQLPSERTLMKTMNVGRSTVREALQGLAAMNLVETRSGYGSRVLDVPPLVMTSGSMPVSAALERTARLQLLDVRQVLETAVVQWAARGASESEIEALGRRLEDYIEATTRRDSDGARLSHDAFHLTIARASHNDIAVRVIDFLLKTMPASFAVKYAGYWKEEQEIHRRIYAALEARDEPRAAAAVVEHMDAERRQIAEMEP